MGDRTALELDIPEQLYIDRQTTGLHTKGTRRYCGVRELESTNQIAGVRRSRVKDSESGNQSCAARRRQALAQLILIQQGVSRAESWSDHLSGSQSGSDLFKYACGKIRIDVRGQNKAAESALRAYRFPTSQILVCFLSA